MSILLEVEKLRGDFQSHEVRKKNKKEETKICCWCDNECNDVKFVCEYHGLTFCESCVKNNYERETEHKGAPYCKGFKRRDCIYIKKDI